MVTAFAGEAVARLEQFKAEAEEVGPAHGVGFELQQPRIDATLRCRPQGGSRLCHRSHHEARSRPNLRASLPIQGRGKRRPLHPLFLPA